MNHIEFDYITEDGIDLVIEASGKIVNEGNYSADVDDHKGYPARYIKNLKFKCLNEDGTLFDRKQLSEDDVIGIEDTIHKAMIENEPETESDFYDRFN